MRKCTFFAFGMLMSLVASAQATYQELYVVGNACAAGWSQDGALPMTKVEAGLFTWTGELKAPGNDQERFKFLVDGKQWAPSITCDINTPEVQHQMVVVADAAEGTIEENRLFVRETENAGSDNAFQVPETGTYAIAINLEAMKMVVVKGTEPVYPVIPTLSTDSLYLVGGAVNVTGEWDHSLLPNQLLGDAGVFTFSDTLYTKPDGSGAEFKFKTRAGSWDQTLVAAVEGGQAIAPVEAGNTEEYDMVFRPFEKSPNDFPFLITATGVYDLTIDLNTKKMTVTGFEPLKGESAVTAIEKDLVKVFASDHVIELLAQGNNVISEVALFDVAGKCINTITETGKQVMFDGLENGLYIVKMTCNGKDYVQKVIVK